MLTENAVIYILTHTVNRQAALLYMMCRALLLYITIKAQAGKGAFGECTL